ncbi:MAG TPA: SulP family inorganic anion transporter, partial [Terriglobales bacterium]|nr:SulP family inorganic anion transporter [Terriglobales bacterium]
LRDLLAGTICSILSVAYCLSYAALIFSGPLKPWLSYGISATFLSAAIAATVIALRSSLPFAIAGPDTSTSAVTATLAAAMTAQLVAEGNTNLLPPVLIVIALVTAATGIVLCFLGLSRTGRAIRFIPYPVIGGFLGATGWLMILGAIQVITDQRLTLTTLSEFSSALMISKLGAGLAIAVTLQVFLSRWTNAFVMPSILVAAILAIHVTLPIVGSSLAEAQAGGWMFRPQGTTSVVSPWQPAELHTFPWTALPWLAGDLVAVIFVTTISLLLNTTGVEIATRREANIDRELQALGVASLLSSALGGYVSSLSLSRTTLAYAAGATGRLTGLTVAGISAGMLVLDPGFLSYVPKYALGGLLFFAGGQLSYRWLIKSAGRLEPLDFLSLVAIALIIIGWGFIAGVIIGGVICCTMFALSASRVDAVKFSFDGSEFHSSLDRSPAELSILAVYGKELQGMALQGYLFFGTANRLYEKVKALIAAQPHCRFLLFDFRLVIGIDSSATHSFTQIKDAVDVKGIRLVLVNLTPELRRAFQAIRAHTDSVIVVSDLDHALEACENAIIEAHRPDEAGFSLHSWMADALGSTECADRLSKCCIRLEVQPGEDVARQGEPSKSMHFILKGRVGIFVSTDDGREVRVRSLGPHTTIGEMGLMTGRPRSATVRAEVASTLYVLPMDAFREITLQDPTLGQALLRFALETMVERLSVANRTIGALQR